MECRSKPTGRSSDPPWQMGHGARSASATQRCQPLHRFRARAARPSVGDPHGGRRRCAPHAATRWSCTTTALARRSAPHVEGRSGTRWPRAAWDAARGQDSVRWGSVPGISRSPATRRVSTLLSPRAPVHCSWSPGSRQARCGSLPSRRRSGDVRGLLASRRVSTGTSSGNPPRHARLTTLPGSCSVVKGRAGGPAHGNPAEQLCLFLLVSAQEYT
jgi:hypothetical protein